MQPNSVPWSTWRLPSFSILGRIGGDATRNQPRRDTGPSTPFSILGRIGGDATTFARRDTAYPRRFQYPRSDRRRCNQYRGGSQDKGIQHFQYPRSDRRRCNGRTRLAPGTRPGTFSILGRIGGDATPDVLLRDLRPCHAFSILGRIGGDATKHYQNLWSQERFLSVSSVGSEAMQRRTEHQAV